MSEFIQLHILTSYPPANLNRDDLGRPKTAFLGGTQRLRISSQSLKRAWRTSDVFESLLNGHVGTRTKKLGNHVYEALVKEKVDPERADAYAKTIAAVFGKLAAPKKAAPEKAAPEGKAAAAPKAKSKTKEKAESTEGLSADAREIAQLAHVSAAEWAGIDTLVARIAGGAEPTEKEYEALLTQGHGTADIALFGRMLADATSKNVEAAAQVAHAISVHRVTVEDDYFTAVDDLNTGAEDGGASHIGTNEFAAGLFYQYICIDRSLLLKNLDGNEALASLAARALVEAALKVAPSGKQNSFGSRAYASYALAERGSEQPRSLTVAFLKAVDDPARNPDYLAAAVTALEQTRDRMNHVYGPCAREQVSFNAGTGDGQLAALLDFVGKAAPAIASAAA